MRRKTIVVMSGPVAGGKSSLARALESRFRGIRLSTRALLMPRLKPGEPATRGRLQEIGEQLDRATGGSWVADGFSKEVFQSTEELVVVDSARRLEQVQALRKAFGRQVRHVHVTASKETCAHRYEERRGRAEVQEAESYAAVRADPTEAQIDDLAPAADVLIDTDRSGVEDVIVRAAAALGLFDVEHGPCVDALVGGLYGSEGKGNIAFHLAPEYDLLVRVGGPNAAHSVYLESEQTFVHFSLPSGTQAGPREAGLLLGAGAVVYLKELLGEIARANVGTDRLFIDPQVMIIEDADKRAERELRERIGSTASGTGSASARRLLRESDVRLARDVEELEPFLRSGLEVLEDAYRARQRIFLEGTQGSGLSLFHGQYPHVTSRDTNVAGCLAEAGIAPPRLRKSILVVRAYPIRVAGPSGPLRTDLQWSDVADRAGLEVNELEAREHTSKTHTLRRVGEFEWDLLRRASLINAPTDVALTFADYLDKNNLNAWRVEQLTSETLRFIDEIERVSGARVSLISTGFMPRRGIIDRRAW